jgi:hypothetical protein
MWTVVKTFHQTGHIFSADYCWDSVAPFSSLERWWKKTLFTHHIFSHKKRYSSQSSQNPVRPGTRTGPVPTPKPCLNFFSPNEPAGFFEPMKPVIPRFFNPDSSTIHFQLHYLFAMKRIGPVWCHIAGTMVLFYLAPNQHRPPISSTYFSLTTNHHQSPVTNQPNKVGWNKLTVSNLNFRFQNETTFRGGTDEAASRRRLRQRDKQTCCVQAACHMHALPVSMQKDCQGGGFIAIHGVLSPNLPLDATEWMLQLPESRQNSINASSRLLGTGGAAARGASALKLLNRLHTRFRKKCWTLHRSVAVALCTHLGEGDTGGPQLFNGSGSYCNCTVCSTVRTPVEPCGWRHCSVRVRHLCLCMATLMWMTDCHWWATDGSAGAGHGDSSAATHWVSVCKACKGDQVSTHTSRSTNFRLLNTCALSICALSCQRLFSSSRSEKSRHRSLLKIHHCWSSCSSAPSQ